ncbi:MAG: ABC transporter ATP-binding protein [Negativicutes bacterium]|nr:ABC transporter ATP-binding protein [Negativicutes bacterium]
MSTAVHIENLTVYYGETPAVTEINLDVEEGEYLGIIGPNGGGKSTLLRAILGLIPITSGEITIYGKKIAQNRSLVSFVPQFSAIDKLFPITLREVVLFGKLKAELKPFFRYSKQDKMEVEALLEKVGIYELANRQITELSGGEFQKMLIARALAVKPKLLLLDEPTASVDTNSSSQIYSLLADLNRNMTIILVTHDLLAVSSQVHRLACLNNRLVYHGEPELTEGVVNTMYGCPVDLIAHGVPHRMLKEHQEGFKND